MAYKTITGANDVLKCAISTDCGQTWSTRLFINSGSMNSGTQTTNFIPNSTNDWRDFTVTTTAAMRLSNNVMFRFDFSSNGGNNIYIDDFRVDGLSSVGIEDNVLLDNTFTIYPNPSTEGTSTMNFELNEVSTTANVYLTDMLGKKVMNVFSGSLAATEHNFSINTSQLTSGIYFVSLETDDKRITKKLIVR